MAWAWFVTNFADQGVLTPMILLIGLIFWMLGWRRGAIGWTVATVGTLITIVIAKILFYFLRADIPFDLISPSSHAASGGVIYGTLLALILAGPRASVRTAVLTSAFVALCFSATRLKIGAHSPAEVIFGSVVGIVGAITFIRIAGRMPDSFKRVQLAGASALVVLMLYGHRWDSENTLRSATHDMRAKISQFYDKVTY